MVKASLKNYRQSPRKVRLVAGLIQGKKVTDALTELSYAARRAGSPMKKLLESAVSNAKSALNAAPADLYVKEFRVDKGVTLKRFMPRARGRASGINKRSSNVVVVLDLLTNKKAKRSK